MTPDNFKDRVAHLSSTEPFRLHARTRSLKRQAEHLLEQVSATADRGRSAGSRGGVAGCKTSSTNQSNRYKETRDLRRQNSHHARL